MIEIEAPDGTIIEFPDETPKDVILSVMKKNFPPIPQPITPDLTEKTDWSRIPGKVVQGALPHALSALLGFGVGGPPGALVGGMAPTAADLASRAYNAAMRRINPDLQVTPTMDVIQSGLQRLPMYDAPRNRAERAAMTAGGALGVAGPQVGALRTLSTTARSPFARNIAETLSRGPKTQIAAAPVAGATSQIVAEETGSPLAGTLAAMGTGAGMGMLARPRAARITTAEELAQKSQVFYEGSDALNTLIKPESVNHLTRTVIQALKEHGWANNKARGEYIHPKTLAWLDGLEEQKGPLSLQNLEYSRRQLSGLLTEPGPDGNMARAAMTKFDEVVQGWNEQSLVKGNRSSIDALEKARTLWKQKRRLETIEELLQDAYVDTKVNYSQAGYEQAIRRGFARIAKNRKKLRKFSKDEQKFINKIAKGGSIQNALRWLGKWKPSGVIATGHGAALGGGAAYAMGFGPEMVAASALAPGVVGTLSRAGATAMQRGNINRLRLQIASGRPPPPRPRATVAGSLRGLLSDQQLLGPGL
jgi:hypothetical protein